MLDIIVKHSGNATTVVLQVYGCSHDLGLLDEDEAAAVAETLRLAADQIKGVR
jgi:hypothetical protein